MKLYNLKLRLNFSEKEAIREVIKKVTGTKRDFLFQIPVNPNS
ncbi:hypothetical protein [Salinimicrobium xinjiangense]|nr:hypothetical protein [Salinimicrobium xinjiangense]